MATIRKILPVGIDRVVDSLQTKLEGLGWSNYQIYPRAYKNDSEGNLIPENYTGNKEYREVLFDDTYDATTFFLADDTFEAQSYGQRLLTTLSVFFQVKLNKLKSSIAHRADEEVRYDAVLALRNNKHGWVINNVITGVANVYAGLDSTKIINDDMSNYHVFRIDMSGSYAVDCNINTNG